MMALEVNPPTVDQLCDTLEELYFRCRAWLGIKEGPDPSIGMVINGDVHDHQVCLDVIARTIGDRLVDATRPVFDQGLVANNSRVDLLGEFGRVGPWGERRMGLDITSITWVVDVGPRLVKIPIPVPPALRDMVWREQ
jgi:hypothetical protein